MRHPILAATAAPATPATASWASRLPDPGSMYDSKDLDLLDAAAFGRMWGKKAPFPATKTAAPPTGGATTNDKPHGYLPLR